MHKKNILLTFIILLLSAYYGAVAFAATFWYSDSPELVTWMMASGFHDVMMATVYVVLPLQMIILLVFRLNKLIHTKDTLMVLFIPLLVGLMVFFVSQ